MGNDLIRLMQTMFLPAAKTVHDVYWQPAADVYRTTKGWLLKFDLAGVSAEDIDVSVEGSRLTVRGARRDWRQDEICNCYLMEITYSHFERTIELPENIQSARIEATHREGMLLIRIHREKA
ncbi:MAG TPA: Hsp20/alpha crystallin family protein [Gemmataceae bacterium]|nr:Hsp20/alpha crystallin family protein [Gemmataceae bacterium]